MLKIFSDFIESIENSKDICLSIKTTGGGVININNSVLANYRLRNLLLINYLPNPEVKEKELVVAFKTRNIRPETINLNETTVILNLVNDFTIKVKFNLSSTTLKSDDNTLTKLSVNLTVVNRKYGITSIDLKDLVEFSTVYRSLTGNYWVRVSCKSINKSGYKKSVNFIMDDQIDQIKLFGNDWNSEIDALPDIKHFISFIVEESLENNEDLSNLIISSIDDDN